MNWLSLFLLIALGFLGAGCEQHHVAELSQIEESPEAESGAERGLHAGKEERPDQEIKHAPDAPGPKFFGH